MDNFSRYKRFFAFGCSMTSYAWATWADIIAQEISEHYNFGQSGAGNLFIACQVTEANIRFNFNKDDLIMIMWSGVSREDRYVKSNWITPGNIFTQNIYNDDFVKKFSDPVGYLLRDLNLITLTISLLDNIGVDYQMLNMAPFDHLQSPNPMHCDFKKILDFFKPTTKKIMPDILTTELKGSWPQHPITSKDGKRTADYHPNPLQHFQYLKKIFPEIVWSEKTLEFVKQEQKKMESIKTFEEMKFKPFLERL